MKLGKYWYDSLKKMKLCVCVSSYDIISVCAGYRWRTKQLTEGTEFQIHLYGLCKFLITIIGYALQRHKMRSHVKYAFTEYTHPNNLPYFFWICRQMADHSNNGLGTKDMGKMNTGEQATTHQHRDN